MKLPGYLNGYKTTKPEVNYLLIYVLRFEVFYSVYRFFTQVRSFLKSRFDVFYPGLKFFTQVKNFLTEGKTFCEKPTTDFM
jgi:hypothetical protein